MTLKRSGEKEDSFRAGESAVDPLPGLVVGLSLDMCVISHGALQDAATLDCLANLDCFSFTNASFFRDNGGLTVHMPACYAR